MVGAGRFDFINGPFARLNIVGKVTGTVFVDLGTPLEPMISHIGNAQFCDPATASAAKQGTLDQLGFLFVSGTRDAGTPTGDWVIRLSFSRLGAPEIQTILTINDAIKKEAVDAASFLTLLPRVLPGDFMRKRTGTVTDSDVLNVTCEIEPSQDLTDTSVAVQIWLVPPFASTFGDERGRLVPA